MVKKFQFLIGIINLLYTTVKNRTNRVSIPHRYYKSGVEQLLSPILKIIMGNVQQGMRMVMFITSLPISNILNGKKSLLMVVQRMD
jgi:hypothetical protein